MSATTISIAMATYNGAAYIHEQLHSLADQTVAPAELVISDDASTDDTLEIVAEFAKTAPFPVHVHRNTQRLGYRGNFMRAASLCRSDLIAFCDQDDVWERDKIEKCAARFKDPSVLLTYHDALVFDSETCKELGNLAYRAAPAALNRPNSLPPRLHGLGFTLIFRRELLAFNTLWSTSIDPWKPRDAMAHDQWFFFLAAALGSVTYIDERLARYRQHGGNVYGWGGGSGPPSLQSPWSRVFNRLILFVSVHGADATQPHEDSALECARALRVISSNLNGEQAERASAASAGYARLARRYAARRRLYTASSFIARLEALRELLANGAYLGDIWSYHPRVFLRDTTLGLLLGPLLPGRTSF